MIHVDERRWMAHPRPDRTQPADSARLDLGVVLAAAVIFLIVFLASAPTPS